MQQILLALAVSLGALYVNLFIGACVQAGRTFELFDNGVITSLVAVALAAIMMSGFIGAEVIALEHGWSPALVAIGFIGVHVIACLLWPSAFRPKKAMAVQRERA